jgi:hypothetical protein
LQASRWWLVLLASLPPGAANMADLAVAGQIDGDTAQF